MVCWRADGLRSEYFVHSVLILTGYVATVRGRKTSDIYVNGKKWEEHINYYPKKII